VSGVSDLVFLFCLFEIYHSVHGETSRTTKQVQKSISNVETKRCEIGKHFTRSVCYPRFMYSVYYKLLRKKGRCGVGGNHTSHIVGNHGSPFCLHLRTLRLCHHHRHPTHPCSSCTCRHTDPSQVLVVGANKARQWGAY